MLDAHRLAGLLLVAVALIAVPGPSVMFVVSRGIAWGRRAALTTVLGNEVGLTIQLVLVALGFGAIVESSIAVDNAIKYLGAAYLIYLGIQAFRHRHDLAAPATGHVTGAPRRVFRQAVVVGVTNPKGFLIFAAVLPQFVDVSEGEVGLQMFILGSICVLVALATDSAWAVVAGTASSWFARSPRRLAAIGGTSGVVVVGLGVELALSDHRP